MGQVKQTALKPGLGACGVGAGVGLTFSLGGTNTLSFTNFPSQFYPSCRNHGAPVFFLRFGAGLRPPVFGGSLPDGP